MSKPTLMIDMLTSDAEEAEDETAPEDTEPSPKRERADPEALLSGIEAQLQKLRQAVSGL